MSRLTSLELSVGGVGRGMERGLGMDIKAEPDEAPDATQANLFGTQSGGIAGGDARHFGEIVDRPEFHVAGWGSWRMASS